MRRGKPGYGEVESACVIPAAEFAPWVSGSSGAPNRALLLEWQVVVGVWSRLSGLRSDLPEVAIFNRFTVSGKFLESAEGLAD